MEALETLKVILEADTNPLSQGFASAVDVVKGATAKIGGALDSLKPRITGLGSSFKGAISGIGDSLASLRPVIGGVGFAITSMLLAGFKGVAASEVVWNDLRITLTNLGQDFDALSPKISELGDQIRRSTKFSDDEGLDALNTLIGYTRDYAEATKLLGPAMDLAAKKQIPLEEAAKALGKAYQGQLGPLERLIGKVEEGATPSETFANALKKVQEQTGGAAKVDTLSESWKQFTNAIGDALKALVPEGESSLLAKLLQGISQQTFDLSEKLKALPNESKNLIQLGAIVGALSGGPTVLGSLAAGIGLPGVAGALMKLSPILGPLGIAIGILGTLWITNFGGMKDKALEFWARIQPTLKGIGESMQSLWESLKKVFGAMLPFIEPIISSMISLAFELVARYIELFGKLISFINNVFKGQWKAAWEDVKQALVLMFGNWVTDLFAWGQRIIDSVWQGITSRFAAIKQGWSNFWKGLTGLFGGGGGMSLAPSGPMPAMAGAGNPININIAQGVYATDQAIKKLAQEIDEALGNKP